MTHRPLCSARPRLPRAAATQPPIPPAAFRQLATAATISGLGDGVTQVVGALLAMSLTRSPLRLSGLLVAQQLPWALGALPAGALVDRVDRRRAMAAACLARAAALGALGLLAVAGRAGLPVLYVVFLVVGAAGLIYENAATAVLPALVGRPRLTRANGRLQAASSLTRSLLAQPLGAWLFTVAAWVPFLLDTAGLLLVTFLTATLTGPARESHRPGDAPSAGPRPALPPRATLISSLPAAPGARPCARA